MLMPETVPDFDLIKEFENACQDITLNRDQQANIYKEICTAARKAWAAAAFSGMETTALKRFFSHQLQQISALTGGSCQRMDAVHGSEVHLLQLADYLSIYFATYLDKGLAFPAGLAGVKLFRLEPNAHIAERLLGDLPVNLELRHCISAVLDHFFKNGRSRSITVGTLDYIELLLDETLEVLSSVDDMDLDKALEAKFLKINFNSLDFFRYLIDSFKHRIKDLPAQSQYDAMLTMATTLQPNSHHQHLYYDPMLPPAAMMFKGWLNEEALILAERMGASETNLPSFLERIGLTLSVPQLACLVRLFFETGIFQETSITEILKSIPRHFAAKRQPVISPGSFSVKYYSSEQKAAAKIKELLLKMIAWLNKHYFPVVVVTSALIAAR